MNALCTSMEPGVMVRLEHEVVDWFGWMDGGVYTTWGRIHG